MLKKAALGFGPDRIRTLVSVETESSHRVLGCFSSDPFILAGNDGMHESSDELEFRPARTTECGGFFYDT